MMELFAILTLAVFFLASIYLFARSRPQVEGSAQALLKARQDLNVLQSGLLPAAVVERIFTRAELEYVAREAIEVQELFLAERKRIALQWTGHLLKRIQDLKQFHLGSARLYSELRVTTEIRLAFEFLTLLAICRALQVTIYLRGPYAAPGMVGRVATAAASLCVTSEEVMNFLKPNQLGTLGKERARKLSAM